MTLFTKKKMHRFGAACATAVLGMSLLTGPAQASTVTADTVSGRSVAQMIRTAQTSDQNPFLVGAGVADITGEPAEVGFAGYGQISQAGSGIHTRQYARAFVVIDPATGARNIIVVLDALSAYENLRAEIVRQLSASFGSEFNDANVMITASHTHATPTGITSEPLYNVTTMGWQQKSYQAQVDGSMRALREALADLAPGNVTVSQSKLTGVGVNRSAVALKAVPQELLSGLVNGVDPSNTTFRFEHNGQVRAVLNWFALHPTSLTNKNTLISSDNKGYASYLLESVDRGVNLNAGSKDDGFVAAFATSNAGDVSPNTFLQPGMGPTNDMFQNMKIQGEKMANEVRNQLSTPGTPVGRGLDSRITFADFSNMQVDAKWTGTGHAGMTCNASLGAAFAAGSVEDGPGGAGFVEGLSGNQAWSDFNWLAYNSSRDLKNCQYPKANLLAVHNQIQQRLPIQVMRFGDYYILGLPGEHNGAVGVQYRKDMAALFGVDESKFIVQGYTGAYSHYVTTPQEYLSQQYEGGATPFGINTMGAYRQTLNTVASSLKDGTPLPLGAKPIQKSVTNSPKGKVLYDLPGLGRHYGQVLSQPGNARRGQTVSAVFVGAHPNNNIKHDSTYLEIQRFENGRWVTVAGDNDPATTFNWQRYLVAQSRVTIKWEIPANAPQGTYRILYHGDSKRASGVITPFTGTSANFQVW